VRASLRKLGLSGVLAKCDACRYSHAAVSYSLNPSPMSNLPCRHQAHVTREADTFGQPCDIFNVLEAEYYYTTRPRQ
jgi:hypothetical protein